MIYDCPTCSTGPKPYVLKHHILKPHTTTSAINCNLLESNFWYFIGIVQQGYKYAIYKYRNF